MGSGIGSAASHVAGGLGLLSPVVSGLLSLFGVGSSSSPAPLPYYTPPPSVQVGDTLRSATPVVMQADNATANRTVAGNGNPSNAAPQITVNVNAMDSQSFMDRSSDIASAVREAMLNLHPINDVVANL